ncbi:MAG: GGDEF domain-containing protein [Pseudoflavonifractor sp.]|nr:GGDEF domain-containing protein [Pseudoflavonifractor sp.]
MREYYIIISITSMSALSILDYIIYKGTLINKIERLFFHLSIIMTIVVMIAEIATVYFDSAQSNYRFLCIIGNSIGFSLSPLIPILLGCMVSGHFKKPDILFAIPALVNLILSLLSSIFPIIFTVNAENVYQRGSFFWVFLIAYVVGAFYLFLKTFQGSKRYQNSNRFVLFALFLFTAAGTSIQVFFPHLHVSWMCISLSICLYYIYYCELHQQIDSVTSLLTRHTYEESLNKIRGRKNVTFFIFDIDDFKSINDRYGHPFGDFCLKATAGCIKDVFSKTGLCFRTGGDEFCVISECTDEDTVQLLYQKFLHQIDDMRRKEPCLPMVSIGYSHYDRNFETIGEAIFRADQQMYCFKQTRK